MKIASRRILAPALLAGFGLASACGGGGGSAGTSDDGTLTLALTDAASDEIVSFTVDVTAITLTKKSGAVVSLLANPVNVDLAALEDLSQVLNIMDVPAGRYESASITLDFTTASCVLVGNTSAAALLDENGNPLTGSVTLPLSLAGAPVDAIGRRHRLLELDFDLNQSLTVDSVNNKVTVAPSLVLRVDRSDPKELIADGTLVSVDAANSLATIDLKTLGGLHLGTVTVQFDGATVFQVDGVTAVGAAGVALLAAKTAGTWVQAYGAIDGANQRLDVSDLEAGAGTWNGGSDLLEGHVIDRSGAAGADATLTVLGHSNDANHSTFIFNSIFTVTTSFANTKVVRRASSATYDTDELNVGQLVRIFGTRSGFAFDAASATSVVRVQPTRVCGYANAAPSSGTLEITLNRVDLRAAGDFTWTDGGTTPPDPAHFTLGVGGLGDNLNLVNGTAVEARGFFAAVDDSNQDFAATSLTNRDAAASVLVIHDRILGFTVATSALSTQIQFTITGTQGPTEVAIIDRGFIGVLPLPTSPTPTIVPSATPVVFTLRDALTGSIVFETGFANFSSDLATALANGKKLRDFSAIGPYDTATNTLTASIAAAVIR